MDNKIQKLVQQVQKTLDEKLAEEMLTQEQIDKASLNLNINVLELCKFQELKSLAYTQGVLNLDEANYVYNLLGNSPTTFNSRTLAEKTIVTKLMQELLAPRVSA
jgi:hypothetical protein